MCVFFGDVNGICHCVLTILEILKLLCPRNLPVGYLSTDKTFALTYENLSTYPPTT